MNWQTIICDLMAVGYTQADIARACKRSQAWVSKHANSNDVDVGWAQGETLLRMHRAAYRRRSSKRLKDAA